MSIKHFERRYDLTLAQMLTLHSAPVTVEAPEAGFAYWPEDYVAIRAGQPFLTQGGGIQLRTTGTPTPQRYADVGSATWLTLVDTDPSCHAYVGRPLFSGGGASDGPTHYGSRGVEAFMAVADPTVDTIKPGAPLILIVRWLLLPTYAENA